MHTVYTNIQADRLNRFGLHSLAAEAHLEHTTISWSNDKLTRIAALREAGNSYVAAEDYELAMKYFEQSGKDAKWLLSMKNIPALDIEYGLLLCAVARLHIRQDKFDEAINLAELALVRFRSQGERVGEAYAISLRGQALFFQGKFPGGASDLAMAHTMLLGRQDEWCLENALAYLRVLEGFPRVSLAATTLGLLRTPRMYRSGNIRIACEIWSLLSPPWQTRRDRELADMR